MINSNLISASIRFTVWRSILHGSWRPDRTQRYSSGIGMVMNYLPCPAIWGSFGTLSCWMAPGWYRLGTCAEWWCGMWPTAVARTCCTETLCKLGNSWLIISAWWWPPIVPLVTSASCLLYEVGNGDSAGPLLANMTCEPMFDWWYLMGPVLSLQNLSRVSVRHWC